MTSTEQYNKIQFLVALIAEFAAHYGLTDVQAARYMSRYKALELCDFNTCMKGLLLAVMVSFFTGCQDNALKMVDGNSINIERAMTVQKEAPLNELFDNAHYTPLETNDSCLLDGRSSIKYIDSENILIESKFELYRFGRSGSFMNRIGRKGAGPEEYIYPGAVSVEPVSKQLFLFNNKRFQVWTFDGKFVKEITIDDSREPVMGAVLNADYLITEFREYGSDGGVCSTLAWLDHSGKIVREETLYKDDTKVDVAMWSSPVNYQFQDKHLLKEEWDTTIYAIGHDGYESFYTLELGQLAPNRKALQDKAELEQLFDNYAVINRFWLSRKYFWVMLFHKETMYEIMIDLHDKTLFHSRRYTDKQKPAGGFGLANPSIEGMIFWPEFIDVEGDAYMLLQPDRLTAEAMDALNAMCHSGIKVDELSNPVLVRVQ